MISLPRQRWPPEASDLLAVSSIGIAVAYRGKTTTVFGTGDVGDTLTPPEPNQLEEMPFV